MALIAHYPLNGDTKDYSGYGRVATHSVSVTYSDEGKIGKCRDSGDITLPSGTMNSLEQSITFWLYNKEEISKRGVASDFMGGSPRDYALFTYPNNNDLHWDFKSVTGATVFSGALSGVLENLKWTHVSIIKSPTYFKIYINGVLRTSKGYIGLITDTSLKPFPLLHNHLYIRINDIRIYDHALSDKEVKEIAKAKVLHYKFDAHEEPTENLAGGVTSFYSPYHTLEKSGNNFKMVMISANFLTLGNGKAYQGQTVSVSGYLFKNGLPHALPAQRINTYHSKNASKWLFNSVTGYFEITQEWTSANTWVFHTPTGAVRGDVLEIKNMQFELKATPTGYTEGVRGGAIVKDSSGFGNDGTVAVATAPSWSDDSPVGRGSMEFDGSTFIETTNSLSIGKNPFTVNSWFKPQGLTTYSHIFTALNQTDFLCKVSVLPNSSPYFYGGGVGTGVPPAMPKLEVGNWYMLTYMYDLESISIFINAVLVNKIATSVQLNIPTTKFRVQNWSTEYGKGLQSDLRIYLTALSPEDILELYRTRASVDNEGNLFVQEIDERDFDIVGRSKTIRVAGSGNNSPNMGIRGTYIDNVFHGYNSRGLNISVYDNALNRYASARFDTYANGSVAVDSYNNDFSSYTRTIGALAEVGAFLDLIPSGYIVAVTSSDSIWDSVNDVLSTSLERALGAEKIRLAKVSRAHYTLLAYKNNGRPLYEDYKDNLSTTLTEAFSKEFNTETKLYGNGVFKANEFIETGVVGASVNDGVVYVNEIMET